MKKKILVIGVKWTIWLWRAVLRKDNFEIRGCFDGDEGMAAIESFGPDLVILCGHRSFPGMSGLQFLSEFSKKEEFKKIKTLFLSASKEYLVIAREMGASGYLEIPSGPKEMRQKVNELLSAGKETK